MTPCAGFGRNRARSGRRALVRVGNESPYPTPIFDTKLATGKIFYENGWVVPMYSDE